MVGQGIVARRTGQKHRGKLIELIWQAAWKNEIWQVWDDFIYFTAASIAQPLQFSNRRAGESLRRMTSYDQKTQFLFSQMLYEIELAYKQEGFTDILGGIYAELGLDDHWGRRFSPADACKAVAERRFTDMPQPIERDKHISVNDPLCGAGAMLIAFAGICNEEKVDYCRDVLFTAQDNDLMAALMCFISMSLLGMAGCVVIGDYGTKKQDELDYWFTPAYFKGEFPSRKQID